MNKLTQALMEELTVEYVKVGSLQIPESVVISWVIMLLLVPLPSRLPCPATFWMSRSRPVHP